jgi:hypothetical protein
MWVDGNAPSFCLRIQVRKRGVEMYHSWIIRFLLTSPNCRHMEPQGTSSAGSQCWSQVPWKSVCVSVWCFFSEKQRFVFIGEAELAPRFWAGIDELGKNREGWGPIEEPPRVQRTSTGTSMGPWPYLPTSPGLPIDTRWIVAWRPAREGAYSGSPWYQRMEYFLYGVICYMFILWMSLFFKKGVELPLLHISDEIPSCKKLRKVLEVSQPASG